MIKERSPRYPSIGLKNAVGKIHEIWEMAGIAECPRVLILGLMGYSSVNGKALGEISALGKYGLLEGREDQLRVSALAVQILTHPIGSYERSHAVVEASRRPKFFNEIYQNFGEKILSDSDLKEYLTRRGFTSSGVEKAIRAYRETGEFVYVEVNRQDVDDGDVTVSEKANEPTRLRKSTSQDRDLSGIAQETDRPTKKTAAQGVGMRRGFLRPRDFSEMKQEMERAARETVAQAAADPSFEAPNIKNIPTVILTDNGFEIGAGRISSIEQFDKLMRRLHAAKALLDE